MEEELYENVVCNKHIVSLQNENKEKKKVYDSGKAKGYSPTQQSPATGMDNSPAPHSQPCHGVAVCLGVLCVLLVSAIIGLSVFSTELSEQNQYLSTANHILQSYNSNISTANQDLMSDKEELTQERDRLKTNLQVIYQLHDFPVNQYCSKTNGNVTKCNPCKVGWMLFQSSCYLILFSDAPWKNWTESREDCKKRESDLVVISSQPEQEFISNQTQSYYDVFHGYWIGLSYQANNQSWMWVDGSVQSLNKGFWNTTAKNLNSCVFIIPINKMLANWNTPGCFMQNRWICESTALNWSY
ncbi:C-type lectin domain family 12 member B-like [Esox lucius]|uniref:C-type lectin domain family 12 member B-like n=1 Tax=Esox lucius TaxID=8010 RepID=UPI0014768849|nr:C-type lectin domain family 12 member B-like [Esox lucius]